jgi:SAM-dependent methyltransferase
MKLMIPPVPRRWLGRKRLTVKRELLWKFGDLRRVTPYRPAFGCYGGQCIDRFYIEKFLEKYSSDICGRVLEVAEPVYTNQFGRGKVTTSDIVDGDVRNHGATIHADLTSADNVADNTYDCIICTQTLLLIYDFQAAIRTLRRLLKTGGVLLCTFPGISQLCPADMISSGVGNDYWRFTRHSAALAFGSTFGDGRVTVETYGNVLAATAMLHGIVSQELTDEERNYHDPDYEIIIAVRARK